MDFINSQPLQLILELKRVAEELQKKDEKEVESFKKDAELPTRHYDGGRTTARTCSTRPGNLFHSLTYFLPFLPVLWIRIRRIRMFLSLQDPSINKQ
jgi:hypothetical protein